VTSGTYIFRLTVTDNSGNTDSDYVKVVVSSASSNTAPTANAGPDASVTLPTSSVKLTGSGKDTDGTIASYAWTKVSGGTASLSNATTSTLTASGLVEGSYVFRLTVKDNAGATGYDDVKVTVTRNQAPTANAGADVSITLPTTSVKLTGSGRDADGTISSYAWAKVSGGTASLSSANTSTLTASNLTSGTYVFRLTVKDNAGLSGYDDVTVVVGGNQKPTANAGSDLTLYPPANSTTIYGKGSDVGGSISSYSWTKLSGGTVTMTNASTANLTISNLEFGKTYFFRLTVKDNGGLSAYDDVMVTVRSSTTSTPTERPAPGNVAPTVNGGPDITLIVPASTARLYGKASDSDGSISSYSWTKVSGGVANLSNANTSNLIAWGLTEGTYIFRLTVRDNDGATAYDDVRVVVTKTTTASSVPTSNKPPVVNAGSDVTLILPGTTARLYGKVSDPEGNAMTFLWTKVSGPSGNLSNETTKDLVAWRLVAGTYVFRLTAKDQYGATAYDDVRVVVK
jgi:ribosomal protein L14